MKNQTKTNRFLTTILLAGFVIVATVAFLFNADDSAQAVSHAPATNISAARDLQMVMQEQERERLDQANAYEFNVQRRARIAAANDLRMVMQELERERFPQAYPSWFDVTSIACSDPRTSCDR